MRWMVAMLALAGLSACNARDGKPDAKPALAALTFDGAAATDPKAVLAHGDRLTHVLGCRGCHTESLEGQWFNDDDPAMGKLYASNLTRVLANYSDQQLETLLRTGVHPTRHDLWVMPSEVFQRLSAADMKALIAYLRTVRPSGTPTPPPAPSAKAKAEMASGEIKPAAFYVAEYRAKTPVDLGKNHALGRYIAAATCAECHGADLTGVRDFGPGVSTPDLIVAGMYSNDEFIRLLTTGKGKTKADLGLMTLVGKGHFAYLTPHERGAVIAYLKARAERPQ
ncbi:MAG: cytochrome c [Sphingomicrobium sp.]